MKSHDEMDSDKGQFENETDSPRFCNVTIQNPNLDLNSTLAKLLIYRLLKNRLTSDAPVHNSNNLPR
ncbi:MAG TPA: hypothetical protein VFH04_01045 [Nitrososphaeraceae archaeon]|nr:hypothetical protein [Nitrososphaeraceae archaeon]